MLPPGERRWPQRMRAHSCRGGAGCPLASLRLEAFALTARLLPPCNTCLPAARCRHVPISLASLSLCPPFVCASPPPLQFLCNGLEEDIQRRKLEAGSEPIPELEQLVQASGKMVLLHKLLPKLRSEGHKVRGRWQGRREAARLARSGHLGGAEACARQDDVQCSFFAVVPGSPRLTSRLPALPCPACPWLPLASPPCPLLSRVCQVLIFSQFKIMLDVLEDYLKLGGHPFERIDGSTSSRDRQAAIDRFSKGGWWVGGWMGAPGAGCRAGGRPQGCPEQLYARRVARGLCRQAAVPDPGAAAAGRRASRQRRRLCPPALPCPAPCRGQRELRVPAVHAGRRAGHHPDRRRHLYHLRLGWVGAAPAALLLPLAPRHPLVVWGRRAGPRPCTALQAHLAGWPGCCHGWPHSRHSRTPRQQARLAHLAPAGLLPAPTGPSCRLEPAERPAGHGSVPPHRAGQGGHHLPPGQQEHM